MCVVQPTTPSNEPAAIIVTNVMRTFSVLSQFESARTEMLEYSGLVEDIVHSSELELVPGAVDAALQTIAHISVSSELQNALLKAGVLWYVSLFSVPCFSVGPWPYHLLFVLVLFQPINNCGLVKVLERKVIH